MNVNVNHIKNFNVEDFLNEKVLPTQPSAIEWRESKKEPLGGWPCFMGQVVNISCKCNIFFFFTGSRFYFIQILFLIIDSLKTLNTELECIEGILSPRRVVRVRRSFFFFFYKN